MPGFSKADTAKLIDKLVKANAHVLSSGTARFNTEKEARTQMLLFLCPSVLVIIGLVISDPTVLTKISGASGQSISGIVFFVACMFAALSPVMGAYARALYAVVVTDGAIYCGTGTRSDENFWKIDFSDIEKIETVTKSPLNVRVFLSRDRKTLKHMQHLNFHFETNGESLLASIEGAMRSPKTDVKTIEIVAESKSLGIAARFLAAPADNWVPLTLAGLAGLLFSGYFYFSGLKPESWNSASATLTNCTVEKVFHLDPIRLRLGDEYKVTRHFRFSANNKDYEPKYILYCADRSQAEQLAEQKTATVQFTIANPDYSTPDKEELQRTSLLTVFVCVGVILTGLAARFITERGLRSQIVFLGLFFFIVNGVRLLFQYLYH